ncbi:serotransferrin-like [Xenia sp. Carnegie-2017]|uniref:serotransferrin-like n=1 Tax=Xenia sp. Carnegie-2017 TaxID=2897299 RepID=UPI001F037C38|nr:serotransferrin-like [Xenia sp. Carnegie-2017]
MTMAAADHMVQNAENLQIVIGQKLPGLDNFIQYYGLAVVKKGTTFNFNSLRNQKSCHTGVGKTVGWKIPVGYMIYNKIMTYTDNQYKSASDFFAESCAPGINGISGVSDAVKTDLCSLCNGTCAKNSTEPYYDYMGAFKCMADGNNDRVGFVKETTASDFLKKYSNYGKLGDYKLLCPDGTTAGMNQYRKCHIGTRPLYAIVTGKSTSSQTIKSIRNMLEGVNITKLTAAGIAYKNVERLVRYNGASVKEYVGSYGNYFNCLNGPLKPSAAPSLTMTPSPSPSSTMTTNTSSPSTTPSAAPSLMLSLTLQIAAILVYWFVA